MFSIILLSAGLSQRFKSPKALATLNSQSVIEHLQRTLLKTSIDEIIIVLGSHAETIKPYILKDSKIKSIYNADFIAGQTSSFKAGLTITSPASLGLLLLPIDYPFINSETIEVILKRFSKQQPDLLIPTYQNFKGHPPVFNRNLRSFLEQLSNAQGINSFFHQNNLAIDLLKVNDPGVISTFNTVEEFEKIKKSFNIK